MFSATTNEKGVTTVVSVTPIAVERDSRTFKIAASFTRFGYRSIVLEGDKSELTSSELPFELRSIETGSMVVNASAAGGRDGTTEGRLKKVRQVKGWVKRMPGAEKALSPFYCLYRHNLHLLRILPSASLYYLHAPYQFPMVYWKAGCHGMPIIYDAHDFYPDIHGNDPFMKWLEGWCVRKAAAVVTVSEGVAHLMRREFGCQPVILRNSQDGRLNSKPAQDLRETLRLPSDSFLLVTVGQAKPGQAVAEALEALQDLPLLVHLAFVGKNMELYREMVERYGLQARVHLVPPVKPDEVVQFIRGADASLIPYYPLSINYENCLPNSFFQSVAAELPLLYPELPEIKRLAEQYGLGIPIDSQSPVSIRTAIMRLLNEPETVSMIKNNLRAARYALSWEQEENILHNLLVRVLSETPGVVD